MIRLAPAIVIGAVGLSVLCGCGKGWQHVEVVTWSETLAVVDIPVEQDLVDVTWCVTSTNSEVVVRFAVKEER